jgi:glutathione-regulated potassium-efflux system protein KefB
MLAERDLLTARSGRDAFAVLLFQDLAVIPLVALLPLLGTTAGAEDLSAAGAAAQAALAVGALAAVLVAGRWLVRPVFRLVGGSRAPEVFTATALLIVVGTAVLVDAAGLSMSLGAFLAGVLLSDSEYRHQLQADIEPFEGLLLGLFFISVGMTVNLELAAASPLLLLATTFGLMAAKVLVVFALARAGGHEPAGALRMAASLGQGGEFAFVLFAAATAVNAIGGPEAQFLTLAVSLSMMATPPLFLAADRLARRLEREKPRPFDTITDPHPPVIICGFGRVGQIVGRILRIRGIPFTALESSAAQVDFVRRFGNKVYYGDPGRAELLRAAGAETAKLLVLAIDDPETSLKVAETVRSQFPHLTVLARARNRRHAHRLMDAGIEEIVRETYFSSLYLSEQVLKGLGLGEAEARRMVDTFRQHDERTLKAQHAFHDDESQIIQSSRQAAAELQSLFEADREQR